jgi:hypothetical protein
MGLSFVGYFTKDSQEGELVMNILSTEEESSEEEKSEKEKEKFTTYLEFLNPVQNIHPIAHYSYFLSSKLLQGNYEFPTPPPKIS